MKYIAYDLETTGLSPQTDQPIEIGIVSVDSATGAVNEYDIFIKTPAPLSADVKRITNISDEMLAERGVDLQRALPAFFHLLGMNSEGVDRNVTIIGHNILGFDNYFLERYARQYGVKLPAPEQFFDTAAEFRALLLGEKPYVHENRHEFHRRVLSLHSKGARYNLAAACDYYGVSTPHAAHRANIDCRYTLQVFEKQSGLVLLTSRARAALDKHAETAGALATPAEGQGALEL